MTFANKAWVAYSLQMTVGVPCMAPGARERETFGAAAAMALVKNPIPPSAVMPDGKIPECSGLEQVL